MKRAQWLLALGLSAAGGLSSNMVQALPASFQDEAPTEETNEKAKNEPPKIPRFATNSPFSDSYKLPFAPDEKRLWARTALWEESPELEIEEWIGEIPDLKDKHLLIEFWATWCTQCRRTTPLLNQLHQRFGAELAVIGISDEDPERVAKYKESHMEYYCAVDTKARLKEYFGVFGLPHVVLIEPGGHIVWEGFPLQPGYELTESYVERILAVARSR